MARPTTLFRSASSFALLTGLFAAGTLIPGGATQAQDPAKPAAEAAAKKPTIADVVVTAQKRKQKVQDVPLSIQVLGATQLKNLAQIKSTQDVILFVPNAQAPTTEGQSRPRWFIRGVGTNNTQPNGISPLGVYFDDVYIANVYNQAFPLFDLDRVEALSGPQGTLWGKAANAGAINYISKAPTFRNEGYATLGYGSNNELEAEAAASGTVVPGKIAARLSIYHDSTDGFVNNLYDGTHAGGGTNEAIRGQILFTPSDDLTVLLNVHGRNYDGVPRPARYVADHSAATSGAVAYYPAPNTLPLSPYGTSELIDPGTDHISEKGASLKATWTPRDLTITSISGYETNDRTNTTGSYAPNGPGSTGNVLSPPNELIWANADYWQASQELRIASSDKNRFTWLGGLYGFDEHLSADTATAFYTPNVTGAAYGANPQYANNPYSQDTDSYSAFGSLGYKITSRLKITVGARWTAEDTKISDAYYSITSGAVLPQSSFQLVPGKLAYADNDSTTYRSWTYDVTPEYRITQDINSYFRYAHGVTPGNFSFGAYTKQANGNFAVPVTRLQPETIDDFEGGLKTQWFEHRLTVNGDLFHYDYSNATINVPTYITPGAPPVVLFQNAGDESISGAETTVEAAPIEGLHVGGNLGLLTTKYISQNPSLVPGAILGAQAPRSPHLTTALYGSYDQRLPFGGDLLWAADLNYKTHYYFYPTIANQSGDQNFGQKAYAVTNTHITWYPQDTGKLSLQFSVLNIFDTHYEDLALNTGGRSVSVYDGAPRTFFFSVTSKFF